MSTPAITATTVALAPGQNADGTFSETPNTSNVAAAVAAGGAPGSVPDFVPEKFRSAADPMKAMAEAYAALEAKLGASKAPTSTPLNDPATGKPAVAPAETPSVEQAPAADPAADAAKAAEAGVDLDAYTQKFNDQGGKLTPEDYAALASKGLNQATVDNYIAGQVALGAQRTAALYDSIGGQDKFTELATWLASEEGAAQVTSAQIDAANKALAGTDVAVASVVLQGLMAKMQGAVGVQPTLLKSTNQPGTGPSDSYASFSEQVAAQSDPRYATDPAYREAVIAKINRSNGY